MRLPGLLALMAALGGPVTTRMAWPDLPETSGTSMPETTATEPPAISAPTPPLSSGDAPAEPNRSRPPDSEPGPPNPAEPGWPEPALDYEISFESDLGPGILTIPGSGSFRLRARNQTAEPVHALRLDYTALRPCPELPATGSVVLPSLEPGQTANLRWSFGSLVDARTPDGRQPSEEVDYVFEAGGNLTGFIPPARVHIVLQASRSEPLP
ncbi:MAG: hypothetical protein VKO64_07785 [Candidatus Sericytochromatia bacterium]|nr:hypothetical protein [Candidatus Sericytochromatia bacterium]